MFLWLKPIITSIWKITYVLKLEWGVYGPRTSVCSWCSWRSNPKDEFHGWNQRVILVKEMYQQIKGWNTYIFEDQNEDPYDTWERIRVSWLEMVNNEEKWRNIILKVMSLQPPWVYGRKLMWCGRKLLMMEFMACLMVLNFNIYFLTLIPWMY